MVAPFNIAAIVLAGGQSKRMKATNKMLADVQGEPMLVRVLKPVLGAKISAIYVVTGFEAPKVAQLLSVYEVIFIQNENYENGLATSLVAGVNALEADVDGVIVVLGDMPLIKRECFDLLISSFKSQSDICVPVFKGKRGNPVLWGRSYFSKLRGLTGDEGARSLLKKDPAIVEVAMPDDGILKDFDTNRSLKAEFG